MAANKEKKAMEASKEEMSTCMITLLPELIKKVGG